MHIHTNVYVRSIADFCTANASFYTVCVCVYTYIMYRQRLCLYSVCVCVYKYHVPPMSLSIQCVCIYSYIMYRQCLRAPRGYLLEKAAGDYVGAVCVEVLLPDHLLRYLYVCICVCMCVYVDVLLPDHLLRDLYVCICVCMCVYVDVLLPDHLLRDMYPYTHIYIGLFFLYT